MENFPEKDQTQPLSVDGEPNSAALVEKKLSALGQCHARWEFVPSSMRRIRSIGSKAG